MRGAGSHSTLLERMEASRAHFSLELRENLDSRSSYCDPRMRDEYGAVVKRIEKYVHHLHCAYESVTRFRYGGSVVPAKPSASGIHVTSLRIERVCDVYIRKYL